LSAAGLARGVVASLLRGSAATSEPARKAVRLVNFSWLTVLASLGLSVLGIYAIDVGQNVSGGPGSGWDVSAEAAKQSVFLVVGLLACLSVALPHYRFLGLISWPLYAVCIVLLVLLLLPGVPSWLVRPRNGARAWIDLGPVDFQPGELAKIAFVLAVSRYLRFRSQHRRFRGLIVPGIIAAIPVGLITLQPDLGTAILFVPALFAVLIAAGARLRHLTLIVLLAAMAAPAAWPFLMPHQKTRIVGLYQQFQGDTTLDQGINYQSTRAQRLIGAGEISGRGDAASRALVHYNRLPERHNDMILAVIVNRFGFWGGLATMGLYLMWVLGAWMVAATCRDPLGRLIATGLPAFVGVQAAVNIGMNLGILPIIGVTLPFVSYGGSSLLASWIMTGLVVNVALHKPRPPFRASFEYADDNGPDPMQSVKPYGRAVGFSGRALTR
jgi:cell division protein FtsW (lipid II flippase)